MASPVIPDRVVAAIVVEVFEDHASSEEVDVDSAYSSTHSHHTQH